MPAALEASLPAHGDHGAYTDLLRRVHEATFAGARPPAHPREVIAGSWRRLRRRGFRPDRRTSPAATADTAGLASPDAELLQSLLPELRRHLEYLVADDALLLVLADAEARIVHSDGGRRMRERAEALGFVTGAVWSEERAGTNAIGTALAARHPVQVHAAEHFHLDQHGWTCAGAPIRDPRSGRSLGVVDLSMGALDAEASTLGFASLLAHTAGLELRERHRRDLEALRSASWLPTRGVRGPWLVADRWGWVAAAEDVKHVRRTTVPAGEHGWVDGIGEAVAEPLADGWLLRPVAGDRRVPGGTLRIMTGEHGARLRLDSAAGGLEVEATRRQADILQLLAHHPSGLSAPQLSAILYGTPERDVTVRAEISRLRRQLGGAIVPAPYRYATGLEVTVVEV